MASLSPTQLTLRYMRDIGWTCAIVEHWNPHAKIRQDLFGFGDILGIAPHDTVLVQCTTGANHATRRKKILASPTALTWVKSPERHLWVMSWVKKKGRWDAKLEIVTEADFENKEGLSGRLELHTDASRDSESCRNAPKRQREKNASPLRVVPTAGGEECGGGSEGGTAA